MTAFFWTCGTGGRIFNTITGGQLLVKIENISNQIPQHFNLFQNYPNPFNSSTTIKFDIKERSYYILEIYNLKGQLIKKLINHSFSPGGYKLNINLFDTPSGVYFYNLSSDKVSDIKKIILSK
ncbi:MAG: T9SS type A sorting domain-containing protein [Ignavibacteria bacterium]